MQYMIKFSLPFSFPPFPLKVPVLPTSEASTGPITDPANIKIAEKAATKEAFRL
jgi:hypothetical protein